MARSSNSTRAWQRMLSGRRLDILDPSPVDVELTDIAHGLARVARWNGQTRGDYPFSVAQHSVLVLEIFSAMTPEAGPRERLYALLHDAPEYVMGDIISPFKAAPVAVQRQIKKADKEAAYHEAVNLAGFAVEEARKFFGEPTLPAFDLERFEQLIRPWPTREAHDRFVDAVDMLATAMHH